ncbi:MAG: hypothetical protein KatS3mg105_3293 [Gemmatales bacterium]|nr:MAG: hypothetical protein KatS3mg105_3293 [Gemmatales bacterium]
MPDKLLLHVPYFRRLSDYVGLWAIEQRAGAWLWRLVNELDDAHFHQQSPKPISALEKISVGGGKNVAVVLITGTLMKSVPSFTSGSSSVQLRRDIRKAANDPDVSAILLAIDSPGGTVAGTDDLAKEVQAAAKKKPVFAQIEDLGASAAYWIASQADKVFANSPTALVGSIGTLLGIYDVSQAAEKEGIRALVFATGRLKGAGFPGTEVTEEQERYFQKLVDETQKTFDSAVRRGRQLTATQLQEVRTGEVFPAEEATRLRLIDGIQSMDATIEQLSRLSRSTNQRTPTRRGEAPMTFDTWLAEKGFDADALTPKQQASLLEVFELSSASGGRETKEQEADRLKKFREELAAETERVHQIRSLCATNGYPQYNGEPLDAVAIREGWDTNRVELEILRRSRPASPAIISRSHERDCTAEALLGAVLLRGGLQLDHPAYQSSAAMAMNIPSWLRQPINADQRQRAMEMAHRFSDLSLIDLCRECVRLDGKDVPHNRNDLIKAAFSGGTLTSIFTNSANLQLLATYSEAPDTTQGWTRETEVPDFKLNTRARLAKGPDLALLPRGGEADHASRSDAGETYSIARYARQFQVDEQDIIDDSLNALADLPREFGLAAARLRPDLVYSILLANPTLSATGQALFSSSQPESQSNVSTSAALAAATLRTAVERMMILQENGVNLNLRPTHILVPPSLRHLAFELTNSSQIFLAGSTDVERGNLNALQADGILPVSDARLQNGVTDPRDGTVRAGSSTTWFLASAMAHTIEVAYRRGTGRSPEIRSGLLDKGRFGMWFDVVLDIGAQVMDWRGFHRATA